MILIAFGIQGPAGGAGSPGPPGPSGVGNVASVLQTNDYSANGAGYSQFGDLTVAIVVSANSKLAIDACGNFKGSGASVFKFRMKVDGAIVQQHAQQQWATGEGFSFSHITGALGAGSHTVVVEVELTATIISCAAASDPSNMGASLRLIEIKSP